MNVLHLTDSPFFGGPERQMLGLAVSLPAAIRTRILCFRDHASSEPFLEQLADAGVSSRSISHTNPHFVRMVADVVGELRATRADVLVCHGYKADVIGWLAATIARVPVISVSRGWTGHTWKVRLNERLDRFMLRLMRAVVCVSEGQAAKVRSAGVRPDRVHVIHNAIDAARFDGTNRSGLAVLRGMFATPPEVMVVGVGRLSPEKGFDQLITAMRSVVAADRTVGLVLLGDGPMRVQLETQVRETGLASHIIFAGFRPDIDRLVQGADILAQSSYTEGLPNVVLEACAAGIPVVATDVGGTGEVVENGVNGYLVKSGDPDALATRILDLTRSPELRRTMGGYGRARVTSHFSFTRQCASYRALFDSLLPRAAKRHEDDVDVPQSSVPGIAG
jgi:glycosyltransferase involved in cell wall biosynthesis